MGSTSSCESTDKNAKKTKNNARLYNLIKVQSDYDTERNTINFSRRDLLNTLSDRSIIDVMHIGGSKNIELYNKPTRDRYSQYERQRLHNTNQNLIGGLAAEFSSVSEAELNGLKQLVMNGAGCGCGENSVLNMNGGNRCSLHNSSESSYNPINSITMSEISQRGGTYGSATSSYMPSQVGSANMSATSMTETRNELGSATSSYMPSQVGSANMSATSMTETRNELGSATSSYMPSQVGSANMSATSMTETRNELGSATSSYMPSQVGSANMSATSISDNNHISANNILNNIAQTVSEKSTNSVNSNITRLKKLTNVLMGGNMDDVSSFTMSTISRTSENAVNYHDLIGGAGEDTVTDGESSSTTTTESTTTINEENSESTVKESVTSRLGNLERASKTTTSTNRNPKASSTSSSHTTGGSSSSGSSSSTTNRSSDTSSSSSSSTTESHKMSQQIYLTSSMSEGNIINAKQFYSSDHGELYSSDTNYLRHNLTKRRFR